MSRFILSVAAFSFVSASFAGNLTGKVNFGGAAPKAAPIRMNADPGCGKLHTAPVLDPTVSVNANKTLANVFVYVKEGVKKEAIPAAPSAAVEFDQKGCMYKPHVVGLRVGQTLKIINSDALLHNVHAMPKANKGFNIGMAQKGQSSEKKFDKPETMIKFKCDVHGWMNAYIGVVEHPFFAVSDDKGAFEIKDLPAGEYTVEAWHEKLGTKTAKVTVTDKGTADFTF